MIHATDIKAFVFDRIYRTDDYPYVGKWLYGCAFFTTMYIIFGLVLIGIPGLSRGGIVTALLGFSWALYGVVLKKRTFPLVLCLPVFFYSIIVLSGLLVYKYPVDAVGKLTTAWLGALMIGIFIANGLSLRFVVLSFSLIIVANLAAYAVGYDARVAHVLVQREFDYSIYHKVTRSTGLAGQANLLVAIVYTFPFLLFLFRKSLGVPILASCTILCAVFMFLTASRSTIPFTVLFIVFGCLFFIRRPGAKMISIITGVYICIISSYLLFSYSITQYLSDSKFAKIEFIRRVLEVLNNQSGSVTDRVELASGFTRHFLEHPFLGYGPDQFKIVSGGGSYAHNNPVELLINYGFVGSIAYYSMYYYIAVKIFRYWPYNAFLIAPLLFLIATEFVFVTHLERPFSLLLCLLLLTCGNVGHHVKRKTLNFY